MKYRSRSRGFQSAIVLGFAAVLVGCSGGSNGIATPFAGASGSPTTGASRLTALNSLGGAKSSKRVLFVSNLDGDVRIYSANINEQNPPLIATITTGTTRPEGVWVDRHDTLYVENGEHYPAQASIEEYKRGASSPFRTITDGLGSPGAVAVDKDGTVYVNSVSGGNTGIVVIYAPGSTTPERTITLPEAAEYGLNAGGMALDPQGNVLAANNGNATAVHVFKIVPGSWEATDLGLQGYGGSAIADDGSGNLYVGGGNGFIAVYPPGATSPSRTITYYTAYGLTATANGTLYAIGSDQVAEFAPGASSPTNVIDTEIGETFTYDAAIGLQ
ncbi:MAG: hypothetical protein JOZ77_05315 [Candidatus Eremiobacteraeota bacterium]|nr:hypothetical protein [Candidatus Eremiobacteraeota bacterium]